MKAAFTSATGGVLLAVSLLQGWSLAALFLIVAAAIVVGVALVNLKLQFDELSYKTAHLNNTVSDLSDQVQELRNSITTEDTAG